MEQKLVLAIPKGRILDELMPLFDKIGLAPCDEFFDKKSRQLRFSTNFDNIDIVLVRSFDVAVFVAYGAAAIGVCGSDVLMEYDSPEIYSPVNLGIGKCRLSVAALKDLPREQSLDMASHVRVATKYPKLTNEYFSSKGIQAECIKLNGAMELAPNIGLCHRIVDLVSSGQTLKANGLEEVEAISDICSYLVVNRVALKTRSEEVNRMIDLFKEAVSG